MVMAWAVSCFEGKKKAGSWNPPFLSKTASPYGVGMKVARFLIGV